MNIILEEKDDKVVLKVKLKFRGKRGATKLFTNSSAIEWINENHPNINVGKILSSPSNVLNNIDKLSGTWVFAKKNIDLDNLNDYVSLDKTIEAQPLNKEQTKDASLPYGLKKTVKNATKTRKKRATKKKTTEE